MASAVKQAVGFNFATSELGQQITDSIVELVRKKAIRPVIGQVLPFEQAPAAITAMANRETIGRVIITP
jgi:NADPH:quinone reductase-like Zn-dependent oxidoreductase